MYSGRQLTISRNGTVIAGVRTKSFTVNGAPVDITTDDDEGYRTLLAESGEQQIDASVEGLLKNDTLLSAMVAGTALIEDGVITLPSGATITGDFRLNSMEVGGEYKDAVTFTAELQSTGEFSFTPA